MQKLHQHQAIINSLLAIILVLDIPFPAFAQTVSRKVEDGGTGPYPALMMTESTLPTHTVFRPKDLSAWGEDKPLPIIAWGNGACANSPWEHVNFLSEVASHGFLVVAIGPNFTAERASGLAWIDTAYNSSRCAHHRRERNRTQSLSHPAPYSIL